MTEQKKAKAIFLEAIESIEPEGWDAFLASACDGDDELLRQVQRLLKSHQEKDSLFDRAKVTVDFPTKAAVEPLTQIGPYKLREQIGEGGMGIVYVAEQQSPVKRKVALKVIKPGMDSKEVVARFEAERQALAMMDHPGIAKVFDGGVTESGQPYFAMELINGIPITQYCDEQKLSIRERLELFVAVCHAVQHAHQKGVIHRDIKPTNVLVTLHDGKPVPVVIDFGVAKATNQNLTDQTIYTRLHQVVGTTLYMSPEQAELSRFGVDTRADIYSLGVLLYEMLAGTTPFDRERFKQAALDEVRRIIREEEPPKPSTRLSTLGISSFNTDEGTVSTASLTFTSANWSTSQEVTITGQGDGLPDGDDVAYTIKTAPAVSDDLDYKLLDAEDVQVTNLDPSSGGSETFSSDANNSNLDIPDNNSDGVSSDIFADDYGITNLIVNLNISHPRSSDLDVFLIGPDDSQIQLFNFSGDNNVADFNGTSSQGLWTVKVIDSRKKKTGTINSWSITVDY